MRIAAQGITVEVGQRRLLDGVDVTAEPGQMLGLIGPNGAGKTTLLRILAGLRAPDHGTVLYDGQSAGALGRAALACRLAYLAQGTAVHWPLAVESVVALGRLPHRRLWGGLAASDRDAVAQAMETTGIESLRSRTITTLSGGERMRALVARVLAVEAEAILADEPVAALDPYYQMQVMDLLAAEARQRRAVIVVLHDLALAARYCDRLVLLHDGRLAAEGPPDEVLEPTTLDSVYRIRTLAGRHGDQLYVLPWQRSDAPEPMQTG